MVKIVIYKAKERIDDIISFDERLSLEYISEKENMKISFEEYRKRHRELFMELLNCSKDAYFITALDDSDKIVGLLWLAIKIDTVSYNEICYIYDIEIEKAYRNKGIGTLLMKKAFEICKDNNLEKIALTVEVTNKRALKWYIKQGFKVERLYLTKNLK
ncbi:MAG: hypothetical protein DRJ64_02360 [Thermoprotei archaeon]|nr:MAG: hypothetical protein B6U94_05175 [Thermofilum sp. ex4484_79]RLF07764.1 MAG: hypothetical protein DRJ64_02360 [Thermoprotei archaeon]